MEKHRSDKDVLSGLIFIAFGLAFGYAASTYVIGTPRQMGPGFFPLVLAGILVTLGLVILVKAFAAPDPGAIGRIAWRGLVLLVPALLIFGYTVRGLGLVPALMIAVFMSSFASRHTTPVRAVVLTVGLTILCIAIFVYALGLPLPMFGPWLNL